MDGITLQVNIAAVDADYARWNVAHLARAHRAAVREVVVTIDACKPQKTKQTDPAVRCPEPEFTNRIAALRTSAEELRRDGLIDRVVVLEPHDPKLVEITRKYSGSWLPETHDYGGRPITGYWAGIEAASTRYVAHYDGDMFVHQEPGFDWMTHAVEMLAKEPLAISAAPRPTPRYDGRIEYGDYATIKEVMPLWPVNGGWKQYFFSTRAFLVDREKLERYLPLGRGRVLREQMLVKTLRRGFPRSAEKMWWSTIGAEGGFRLILATERAWTLHPSYKPPHYAAMVPGIITRIENGDVPPEQFGLDEINLPAWETFLKS